MWGYTKGPRFKFGQNNCFSLKILKYITDSLKLHSMFTLSCEDPEFSNSILVQCSATYESKWQPVMYTGDCFKRNFSLGLAVDLDSATVDTIVENTTGPSL